jgi:hypothetical protein
VIVGVLSACVAVIAFILHYKNKKITELETQLAIKSARLELEQVLLKYRTTLEEIKNLREKDNKVGTELAQIEIQLSKKLSEDLTAEQIAEKFKEIGI